ncbi:MAG: amidohydrolase [Gemmatimonadota bacterium]
MESSGRRSGALLIAAFLAGAPAHGQVEPSVVVAIEGATLIDGRGGTPLSNALVLVSGGRIRAVGHAGSVQVPSGATRIDARGMTLLPGFVDVHAHVTLGPVGFDRDRSPPAIVALPDPEGSGRNLALLLAHGVTTARDPGGAAERTVAARDSVLDGLLPGPRLFVAGEVIDQATFPGLSAPVSTPEEIRQEVRRQAAIGVDVIKLYASLTPELVAAGIDEAHRQGLPVIGHIMGTSWAEAAALGLDGIVHIIGWSPKLLPESSRAAYTSMLGGTQYLYGWLEHLDLAAPEMRRTVDLLAQRRVAVDPDLVVFERAMRGDDPAVTQSPELSMAPPALLENWRSFFTFNTGWSADDYARARAAWPKALELTKLLFDRGVLLGAGTDASNPWTVAGESFHREMELLVQAGIPPLDVLGIATRNGARILGIDDDSGTVEVGKRADLVLLREDPLRDISATRSIEWVMKGGEIHRPQEILAPWMRPASRMDDFRARR